MNSDRHHEILLRRKEAIFPQVCRSVACRSIIPDTLVKRLPLIVATSSPLPLPGSLHRQDGDEWVLVVDHNLWTVRITLEL